MDGVGKTKAPPASSVSTADECPAFGLSWPDADLGPCDLAALRLDSAKAASQADVGASSAAIQSYLSVWRTSMQMSDCPNLVTLTSLLRIARVLRSMSCRNDSSMDVERKIRLYGDHVVAATVAPDLRDLYTDVLSGKSDDDGPESTQVPPGPVSPTTDLCEVTEGTPTADGLMKGELPGSGLRLGQSRDEIRRLYDLDEVASDDRLTLSEASDARVRDWRKVPGVGLSACTHRQLAYWTEQSARSGSDLSQRLSFDDAIQLEFWKGRLVTITFTVPSDAGARLFEAIASTTGTSPHDGVKRYDHKRMVWRSLVDRRQLTGTFFEQEDAEKRRAHLTVQLHDADAWDERTALSVARIEPRTPGPQAARTRDDEEQERDWSCPIECDVGAVLDAPFANCRGVVSGRHPLTTIIVRGTSSNVNKAAIDYFYSHSNEFKCSCGTAALGSGACQLF